MSRNRRNRRPFYKLAAKQTRVGEVEDATEDEAIEKAAAEFKQYAAKLMQCGAPDSPFRVSLLPLSSVTWRGQPLGTGIASCHSVRRLLAQMLSCLPRNRASGQQ